MTPAGFQSRTRWLRHRRSAGVVLTLAAASWLTLSLAAGQLPSTARTSVSQDDQAYLCPMHPDVVSDVAGTCPRCRMSLVLGRPWDMRDYRVELHTTPALVRAGEKIRLDIVVLHPDTGDLVRAFAAVHEKRFHLFVVSQDLSFFEHVHPEQDKDGVWTIEATLPKPGYYTVLSDFVPFGGSAQFIALPLVTAGYEGDLVEDSARLAPDGDRPQTARSLTASVDFDDATLWPAEHTHLTFTLTRAGTAEPVTDLQTYLGAFGHLLIASEDLTHLVHSHPIDILPQDADLDTLRGGPHVMFEATMPVPGRYRAWAQFRHQNEVQTFPFTFEVGRR